MYPSENSVAPSAALPLTAVDRALLLLCALHPVPCQLAVSQDLVPSFYYLNVGFASGPGPLAPGSAQNVQRLRASIALTPGPLQFDAAYEQTLTLSTATDVPTPGLLTLRDARGADWLPFQSSIKATEHARWNHRLDRLAIGLGGAAWDVTVGRQTISYATTLFLTPSDPFLPFDPADPFRSYRGGVDAVRARSFLGAFTTLEGVFRLAEVSGNTAVTALARGQSEIGGIEWSTYAGVIYEEAAGSLGATVTEAGAAFRGEVQIRQVNGEAIWRFAAGVDRSFTVSGRTLYVVLEYQRDGLGAADRDALFNVATSTPYARGELQVLGRNEAALMTSYQLHPLWGVDLLTLGNLNDHSALVAPAVTYAASNAVSLRAGMYFGFGRENVTSAIGSEYGGVPVLGYVSLEASF